MSQGFRTVPAGGIAAPPYTNGPYSFSEDITYNGNLRKSPGRYCLEEYFKKLPDANGNIAIANNLNFEILGTNADIADFSWSTINGGVLLETGSADNDQVIVLPHLNTKQTSWAGVLWGTENQVIWEAQLMSTAVITPILVWAGLKLTNDPTTATDDDQVFFKFDTDVASETTWQIVYSIGGTDVTVDTGVTYSAATAYNLRIEIDSARKAHFYINDVRVGGSTALTDDIDLIPYVGLQQLGSGDSSLVLSYQKISRILFE